MDDDLVLLTSYFNLANGRRQDTADTFRVDPSLPSGTSPDGTAALYIVTESSSAGHMGPRARRLAADTIAWEYSTHHDDPPAARLKAALRTAHDEIVREFDGHVSVGASVIAVEHKDVFLAQVAPAQVYVLHEGSLHSISATVGGSSPFAHALGAATGPQVSVFRDEVGAGDVLALCSSWFHRSADPEDLRGCFGAGNADDIAESLLELGKEHDLRDAQVIVIEAALASELDQQGLEEAGGFMEQVDMAVQALANVGRMVLAELRPAGAAAGNGGRADAPAARVPSALSSASSLGMPGATTRPATYGPSHQMEESPIESRREDPAVEEPSSSAWSPDDTHAFELEDLQETQGAHPSSTLEPTLEQSTEEVPVIAPESEADRFESELDRQPTRAGEETFDRRPRSPIRDIKSADDYYAEAGGGDVEPPVFPRGSSEIDQINSRLQYEPDLGDVIPPVQAFPDTSTEPSRIYATKPDVRGANRRPRRFGGASRPHRDPGASAPVIRPGLGGIDLRRPMSRPAPPAVVWLTAAVVLVFAIGAAILFLSHRHGGGVTDPYPGKFKTNIQLALAAQSPSLQDLYLSKAQQDIVLAQQSGDTRANLTQLRARLATATDTIYKTTREPSPVLIAKFQQPAELAVTPDTVYVLDAGKKVVYSLPPNANSAPTQIVQPNESDSGYTFGTPQHLTTALTTALVLDDKLTLVRYANGTKTATSLTPPSSATKISQMVNFASNVYLLDAASNQIWVYPNAVTADNSQLTGFFSSPNTPGLSGLVSFVLDDKSLYLLLSSGKVLKFDSTSAQATAQPFNTDPAALRATLRGADDIFTDVGLNYVWIADPANARIVQLDKTGKYIRSYKSVPSTGMDLSQVKGIAVPPDGKTLYVLTSTALFKFPVTP